MWFAFEAAMTAGGLDGVAARVRGRRAGAAPHTRWWATIGVLWSGVNFIA
jgi:hypothetical protein